MSSLCKSCGSVHCQNYQHCQDYQNLTKRLEDKIKVLKEQVSRLRKRIGKDYQNENKRLEDEIAKLKIENKALKKQKKYWWRECLKRDEQLDKVKESMDELLEAYKEHRSDMCRLGVREGLIKKAEALKEKENE